MLAESSQALRIVLSFRFAVDLRCAMRLRVCGGHTHCLCVCVGVCLAML